MSDLMYVMYRRKVELGRWLVSIDCYENTVATPKVYETRTKILEGDKHDFNKPLYVLEALVTSLNEGKFFLNEVQLNQAVNMILTGVVVLSRAEAGVEPVTITEHGLTANGDKLRLVGSVDNSGMAWVSPRTVHMENFYECYAHG